MAMKVPKMSDPWRSAPVPTALPPAEPVTAPFDDFPSGPAIPPMPEPYSSPEPLAGDDEGVFITALGQTSALDPLAATGAAASRGASLASGGGVAGRWFRRA